MSNNHGQLQFSAVRQAFTLVELLVVGVIIVMLMTLTLFVMNMVTASTKEAKTRATVQKLDAAMQQIFEAYEDRFIVIKNRVAQEFPSPTFTDTDRQKIAAHFIRDTMRMEMPQSWAEVYDSTDSNKPPLEPIKIAGTSFAVEESPLLSYYWQAYQVAEKPPGRAALLFLIIQNLNPEALETFHGNEVADTDGDGLLEFVDAWGNPIQFLRWAPAFPGSDVQPDVLKMAEYAPKVDRGTNKVWWDNRNQPPLSDAMMQASAACPDLLDERVNNVHGVVGWFLYPLIYSAGPDGRYDIIDEQTDGNNEPVSPIVGTEDILDPYAFPYGMPGDADGNRVLNHFDNIHNHRWYRSF